MKGDFTRSTFDQKKHYSSVRMQQGRVQLDADWNEQADIRSHHTRTQGRAVIGLCGAPIKGGGFKIEPTGDTKNLNISSGIIYVDGILCENDSEITIDSQEDLPGFELTKDPDTYLAYLDVWQRHITSLEDPDIREVALGGPDTATRTRTICQVKLLEVDTVDSINCLSDLNEWTNETTPSSGKLNARSNPGEISEGPCIVPPGAGYRRLENQLYRVEIQNEGLLDAATFKWSRDNGSVVTSWLTRIENKLTVSNTGRDEALGFSSGQWVELTDDTHELKGEPGTLVKIDRVDGQILTIDDETASSVDLANFPINPRIRRWDSDGEATVSVPATNEGWIPLEDGVEVKFEAGTYKTGDYWLIPARTAKGDIEWPHDSAMEPLAQLPHGIEHHYCRLALLGLNKVEGGETSENNWTHLSDCRRLFPAVTELTSLFYVSGDGQEAMPGEVLSGELIVSVANGQWPVGGATVRFTVIKGSGNLTSDDLSGTSIEPATKNNGLAACKWELDEIIDNQQVEATLLDDAANPIHIPIRFNANLSVASGIAYDPEGCSYLKNKDVETVQDAIDEICTEPGIHIENVLKGQTQTGDPLANGTDVFVNELVKGLQVICDQEVDGETINGKPTCFVTLDMPFPFNSPDQELWGRDDIIGYRPLILAANIKAEGNTIHWIPTSATHSWLLEKLFGMMIKLNRGDRLLAHLTLKGNFIWAEKDSSLYLDGEAFGVQAGKTETNLKLPIGNGRRGGDFEMWFWLMESNGIRYVEYDIFDILNIPEDLIVENGLCDDGKKNCDTQGEGESKISGGRFYAMDGGKVALNGNSDALVDLLVNEGVDDGHVINVGESFSLPGGITLTPREIDVEGQKAMFSLSKNGREISNKVVKAREIYTHIENEIMGEKEVPVFVTFVETVFAGMNAKLVKITGTWLISMDA